MVCIFAVCAARGQDAGTQQQIDKLSGQIQDLLATQEQQEQTYSPRWKNKSPT